MNFHYYIHKRKIISSRLRRCLVQALPTGTISITCTGTVDENEDAGTADREMHWNSDDSLGLRMKSAGTTKCEQSSDSVYLSIYIGRVWVSRSARGSEKECLLLELRCILAVLSKFSTVKPKSTQHNRRKAFSLQAVNLDSRMSKVKMGGRDTQKRGTGLAPDGTEKEGEEPMIKLLSVEKENKPDIELESMKNDYYSGFLDYKVCQVIKKQATFMWRDSGMRRREEIPTIYFQQLHLLKLLKDIKPLPSLQSKNPAPGIYYQRNLKIIYTLMREKKYERTGWVQIPDLWSSSIKLTVLTYLFILKGSPKFLYHIIPSSPRKSNKPFTSIKYNKSFALPLTYHSQSFLLKLFTLFLTIFSFSVKAFIPRPFRYERNLFLFKISSRRIKGKLKGKKANVCSRVKRSAEIF
ncbi:hypothetical protein VP01_779g3 [Puccinia sorghi]|uniref:Uncharacterized protein n=1 Tax=Puccinia sorghi TaxID=27349 RepID=A0A0L6UBA3_9BASI|nr:hypothetical protein VP01_779g3 [Puccinia sorghi]